MRFGPVQNGYGTFRFGYGSAHLLNGPVRLPVTVHANMNRYGTIYKWDGLARELFIFLKF